MARAALLLAASLLTLSSCADTSGPDPAEQIFTSALAQWNEFGPDSYDLVLKRQCVCTPSDVDVTIQVRNGTVAARFYTGTELQVPANQVSLYPDVPGLFQLIRNAMDNDPFFLSAEYDQNFGHPVNVQLDLVAGRTDDNVVYTSLSLTPVE
jgi:hypothetical protein